MNSKLAKNLHDLKTLLNSFALEEEKNNCFLTNCLAKSIKSHSLSESKILKDLEGYGSSKSMVLYHLDDSPEVDFSRDKTISSFQKNRRRLQEKRKASSSTFYGFCSKHDTDLFRRLDTETYINDNNIHFLHFLRAQAYGVVKFKEKILFLKRQIESVNIEVTKSIPIVDNSIKKLYLIFEKIPDNEIVNWQGVEQFKEMLNTIRLIPIKNQREDVRKNFTRLSKELFVESNFPMNGLEFKMKTRTIINSWLSIKSDWNFEELESLKKFVDMQIKLLDDKTLKLSKCVEQSAYTEFQTCTISINGFFPISACFLFNLLTTEEITLSILPEKITNKTNFIFTTWNPNSNQKTFLSKVNIGSIEEVTRIVTDIILYQGTNVYFSPSYWTKLPIEIQEMMVNDKKQLSKLGFNFFDNSIV